MDYILKSSKLPAIRPLLLHISVLPPSHTVNSLENTDILFSSSETDIFDKILLFALPLAISSILQQLFNSVDVAVVGRFASSEALAAVGSNSSVISLLINLFVGISVGANVVIANYIGQGKTEKIQDAVHTVMIISLISGVFLLVLGLMIARPILEIMGTPENVIDLAVLYLHIYFLGMPFLMIYNFGAAVLRSKGDTKRPLYCLIISGVINACLNLLFVIVFKLSVAGVAIATVIADGVSAVLIIYFLMNEEETIRLRLNKLKIKKSELIKVIKIGVPAGLQGVVFSVSNVCIQTAINSFGSDAVAGSATGLNFEYFTYFTISAFVQAAVTFTSQNYGARNFKRCKKIFVYSMISSVVICGLMSAIFVVGRDFFAEIYTTDKAVLEYASIRMVHVLLFECLASSYEIGGAALRGLGYSMTPAVLTVLGSCVFRLIWIYTVFNKFRSFEMLMNVYPVSWIITGIAVLIAYAIVRKKLFKET